MSELPEVTLFTSRACATARLGRDACLRLTLLGEELFTNTVAHGHGRDSEAPVTIAFDVEPGRIGLVYEDTGPAHDPFAFVASPDEAAGVEERPVGGLGVVLISHNMTDVFEVADRITALYLGRVAADVPAKDLTHSQVVELITAGRSGDLGISENPATATV